MAVALGALVQTGRGDGGVPIATIDGSGGRCTLLMQPAQPRVGQVTFVILGPVASCGACSLRMVEGSDSLPIPVEWRADASGWVGTTQVDAPGPVQVEWLRDGVVRERVQLQIAEAEPAWLTRLPWVLAWVPLALLLVVRARAVAGRNYTASREP